MLHEKLNSKTQNGSKHECLQICVIHRPHSMSRLDMFIDLFFGNKERKRDKSINPCMVMAFIRTNYCLEYCRRRVRAISKFIIAYKDSVKSFLKFQWN